MTTAPPRSKDHTPVPASSGKRLVAGLFPLILLAGLVVFLILLGPAGIFPGDFPPVEDLSFGRVTLDDNGIELVVTNGGADPVTISQVLVDEAYWFFSMDPDRTLGRLKTAKVSIPYPWQEGEPHEVVLITTTGTTFAHEIEIAAPSPPVDSRFLWTFTLLGLYIGLIPVLLGMTWMPFLRTLDRKWLHFFMAFTAGILVLLFFDTLGGALESAESMPSGLSGDGLVVFAAIGSFFLIMFGSNWLQSRTSGDRRVVIAYAVAAGIGLHNLGEGLAVGSAYRLGEIALGTFLVIGFAIHNTTEGLGIVSIIGDRKRSLSMLLALGMIAGVPTIFGAWMGAYLFNPWLATAFLAIAAGAIAEVVYDVMKVVHNEADGGLLSPASLIGLTVGLAVMYGTGLLIPA